MEGDSGRTISEVLVSQVSVGTYTVYIAALVACVSRQNGNVCGVELSMPYKYIIQYQLFRVMSPLENIWQMVIDIYTADSASSCDGFM